MWTPSTKTARVGNHASASAQPGDVDYLEELDFMARRQCWQAAKAGEHAKKPS